MLVEINNKYHWNRKSLISNHTFYYVIRTLQLLRALFIYHTLITIRSTADVGWIWKQMQMTKLFIYVYALIASLTNIAKERWTLQCFTLFCDTQGVRSGSRIIRMNCAVQIWALEKNFWSYIMWKKLNKRTHFFFFFIVSLTHTHAYKYRFKRNAYTFA